MGAHLIQQVLNILSRFIESYLFTETFPTTQEKEVTDQHYIARLSCMYICTINNNLTVVNAKTKCPTQN